MAASLKKVTEAIATDVVGSWNISDLIPNGMAEASKPKKEGDHYVFDVTYYRQRGHPKTYRLTVEEIH